MFGRRLHSPLDNLRPSHERKMHQEQERQRSIHDRRARPREFSLEDLVYAQNYGPGAKWLPGQVSGTLGSAMFEVTLTDGRKIHRHADQLRSRTAAVTVTPSIDGNSETEDDFDMSIPNTEENTETSTSDTEPELLATTPAEPDTPRVDDGSNESNSPHDTSESSPHATSEGDTVESNTNTGTNQPNVQRSNRTRNPPTYYSHSGMFT